MRRHTPQQEALIKMFANAIRPLSTSEVASSLGIHYETCYARLILLEQRGTLSRHNTWGANHWSLVNDYERHVSNQYDIARRHAQDKRLAKNAARAKRAKALRDMKAAEIERAIDEFLDAPQIVVTRQTWEPVRRSAPYSVFTLGQQNGL